VTNPDEELDPVSHRAFQELAAETLPAAQDAARDEHAVQFVAASLRRGKGGRRSRYFVGLAAAALLFAGVAGANYTRGVSYLREHQWLPYAAVEKADKGEKQTARPTPPSVSTVASPESLPIPDATTELGIETPPARLAPSPSASETAAQLFSEANDLRRSGKENQAIAAYGTLQRLFPGSPESALSYATLGSLLLEHGRAQEALVQFDRYLKGGGPLMEDVLAGRAGALKTLGRARDERRAWETLLQRYPSSVYAARAKTRLSELP